MLAHVDRGGTYYRVADPGWADPLDGLPGVASGGRWNSPGSFPVVYLNRTKSLARKFVAHKLRDHPYAPEDLDPNVGPSLVSVSIPNTDFVDIVTNDGCSAAGLPETYPYHESGERVKHDECWPIGKAAWDAEESGIACRSASDAAIPTDEELAWFHRQHRLVDAGTESFTDWFFEAT
jgi:RES domain-containing protein